MYVHHVVTWCTYYFDCEYGLFQVSVDLCKSKILRERFKIALDFYEYIDFCVAESRVLLNYITNTDTDNWATRMIGLTAKEWISLLSLGDAYRCRRSPNYTCTWPLLRFWWCINNLPVMLMFNKDESLFWFYFLNYHFDDNDEYQQIFWYQALCYRSISFIYIGSLCSILRGSSN